MQIHRSSDNKLDNSKSVFLAGPTHRTRNSTYEYWREQAIDLFKSMAFDGDLYLPEPFSRDYKTQIAWEEEHLEKAACILFWVPRELNLLPAFTTNIEFGEWMKSGKVVLGFPETAPGMDYMYSKALKYEVPVNNTLKETVEAAIDLVRLKNLF